MLAGSGAAAISSSRAALCRRTAVAEFCSAASLDRSLIPAAVNRANCYLIKGHAPSSRCPSFPVMDGTDYHLVPRIAGRRLQLVFMLRSRNLVLRRTDFGVTR